MDPMLSWIDTRVKFLLPLLIVLGIAVPAAAQGPGVRGGVSVDPDQVYFGGHYETEALIDRLHFRPNVELGLGDDLVTTALNMEFVYKFPTRSRWLLYAGGGPAVNFYSYDDDGQGEDNTNTEGGLNLLFGVENRGGLFFEVKVGAFDSPDLKFGVGYTFR
jgi:hypothetical protein